MAVTYEPPEQPKGEAMDPKRMTDAPMDEGDFDWWDDPLDNFETKAHAKAYDVVRSEARRARASEAALLHTFERQAEEVARLERENEARLALLQKVAAFANDCGHAAECLRYGECDEASGGCDHHGNDGCPECVCVRGDLLHMLRDVPARTAATEDGT